LSGDLENVDDPGNPIFSSQIAVRILLFFFNIELGVGTDNLIRVWPPPFQQLVFLSVLLRPIRTLVD